MKVICQVTHGSRLYGLAGPNSDYDYKSIHLPSAEDCLLMTATKTSNEKDEEANIEHESFSLQRFLRLAMNSESIVIDMLHCNPEHTVINSVTWDYLRSNKKKFYTKKMAGSLGYAKNMALKYGIRADRMQAAENVLKALTDAQNAGVSRLHQCWDSLPDGQHIYRGVDERNNNSDNRYYEVSGKKLQATVMIEYAIEIISNLVNGYGARVTAAKELNGADLKAISHSFRVGYQLYHIYKNGGFSYPLPETEFLRDIKYGKLDFVADKLDQKLNDLVSEVEELAKTSAYPDTTPWAFVRSTILSCYGYF